MESTHVNSMWTLAGYSALGAGVGGAISYLNPNQQHMEKAMLVWCGMTCGYALRLILANSKPLVIENESDVKIARSRNLAVLAGYSCLGAGGCVLISNLCQKQPTGTSDLFWYVSGSVGGLLVGRSFEENRIENAINKMDDDKLIELSTKEDIKAGVKEALMTNQTFLMLPITIGMLGLLYKKMKF